MWRKIMISAAAVAFVGAMAATTAADARMGGFGGGFRGGGGFHAAGIGMRGGFVGARPFVGGRSFVGARPFIGAHRFVGARPFIGPRRFGFARFHRFHRFNRFAFASVPFFVGAGISCWRWVPTAWGWQRVWVC
jgi:hypothetical protein